MLAEPLTDDPNPLIDPSALPHGAPAFDRIRPEHFPPAMDWALERARVAIEAIKSNPAPPDFENTVEALESATADLACVWGAFATLRGLKDKKGYAAIKPEADKKLADFNEAWSTDIALFRRLRRIAGIGKWETEKRDLWACYMDKFSALDSERRAAARQTKDEINNLSAMYSDNLDSSRIKENKRLAVDILRLRDKWAAVMTDGDSYAETVLKTSMIGSRRKAREFLDSAMAGWQNAARAALPTSEQTASVYNFQDVRRQLEAIIRENFNIKLVPAAGKYPAWHPDVEAFEAVDGKTGAVIGLLYADYYGREDKNGGGWAILARSRAHYGARAEIPIAVISCNIRKDAGGRETWLGFDEALTLSHETGHAIRMLMAGRYPSLSAGRDRPEYAEIFSMFFESLFSRPEIRQKLARDPGTKAPLSGDCRAEEERRLEYLSIVRNINSTGQALVDLSLHASQLRDYDDANDLVGRVKFFTHAPEDFVWNMLLKSHHVFSDRAGYASRLYSYVWARAAAATVEQAIGGDRQKLRALFSDPAARPVETFRRIVGRDVDPDAPFKKIADARPRVGVSFDLGKVGRGRIIEITTP